MAEADSFTMAKQVVTSYASSTPIPGSGNAFFVTWTFNTNTELTGKPKQALAEHSPATSLTRVRELYSI